METMAKARAEKELPALRRQIEALRIDNEKALNDTKKLKVENETLKINLQKAQGDIKLGSDLHSKLALHEEEMLGKEQVIESLRESANNLQEIIEINTEASEVKILELENKIKKLLNDKNDFETKFIEKE